MSLKDSNEKCVMYSNKDHKEIMIGFDIDEVMEECFDSFLQRYQGSLENSMKGGDYCLLL